MSGLILVEPQGSVAIIRLNRPEVFNAMNFDLIDDLARKLTGLACDASVRAVVLTGEGRAFCSGGDLAAARSHEDGAPAGFHRMAGRFHAAVTEIRRMPKAVIAAINGPAAGGGMSLALACDFRVMARSAYLKLAYTSAGLCIDGGGTHVLPRLVGTARALEIAAFDEPLPAEKALELGLVTKIADDEVLLDEALAMAGELTKRSLHALAWAKRLFNESHDTSLETQLEKERLGLETCADHADGREGLTAFVEKRRPEFT